MPIALQQGWVKTVYVYIYIYIYFPQVTTFDLFLLINSKQITSGHSRLQNSSTRFVNCWGLAVRTSNIMKLLTCGCGLQELRSCGLAVVDFKNYEVADLRLWTSNITKLRTCGCGFKNPKMSLRTCGCGLRKLKFGCGFANCGLKKTLAVPSTGRLSLTLSLFWISCQLLNWFVVASSRLALQSKFGI